MIQHSDDGNDEIGKWYWEKAWESFYRRDLYDRNEMRIWYELNRSILGHKESRDLRILK